MIFTRTKLLHTLLAASTVFALASCGKKEEAKAPAEPVKKGKINFFVEGVEGKVPSSK